MRKMAGYSHDENRADAQKLARMLHALYMCPKPTVARVHGDCYAGGVGLVAACDIAVVAAEMHFCLSEVRIGLIPAVISPYVMRAMGNRALSRYMLTAEPFTGAEAHRIGFVQAVASLADLDRVLGGLIQQLALMSPNALKEAKRLKRDIAERPLDDALIRDTADRIAEIRASEEGREGVELFLNKRRPSWLTTDGTKAD
jgi:methylglutaconyl-CoA hydratase